MQSTTHEIALAGVFCALAVVLLLLSGILPLSTFFWPILASCTLIPLREKCRKSYAWCSFCASALLALFLCTDREAAFLYCFLGYYPLLKPRLDRISSVTVRYACKLALCAVTVGSMYLLLIFVFRLEALIVEFRSTAPWLLGAGVVLGVLLFIIYDLLIDKIALRCLKFFRK